MARKRLIKGANAVRVEERIARVPADVSGPEPGLGIFDALRAMEAGVAEAPAPLLAAAPPRAEPKPRVAAKKTQAPNVEGKAKVEVERKTEVLSVKAERKTDAPSAKAVQAPEVRQSKAEPKTKPARSRKATHGRKPGAVPAVVPPSPVHAQAPVPAPTPVAAHTAVTEHAPAPEAGKPHRPGRIGTSDFTATERDTIVRCCSDYRNHLPIYLLAVQREVEIIDSVIEKCIASGIRHPKPY